MIIYTVSIRNQAAMGTKLIKCFRSKEQRDGFLRWADYAFKELYGVDQVINQSGSMISDKFSDIYLLGEYDLNDNLEYVESCYLAKGDSK